MANSNQVELVVTVEVDKANQSIKSVNANLSGIEAAATKSARAASNRRASSARTGRAAPVLPSYSQLVGSDGQLFGR